MSSETKPSDKDLSDIVREVVFGVEDGMVSTLGTVSGIAVGSNDQYTVLMAGIVIIAVESISMGIGSYLSNNSSKEIADKALEQEKTELKTHPEAEQKQLYRLFVRDGWSKSFALKMTRVASDNYKLLLKEHQYRELGLFPYHHTNPLKNGLAMFFAYIVGGLIPLSAYFLLPLSLAVYWSFAMALIGLFTLGAFTTRFTNVHPAKAGLRTLVLGATAFLVGTLVGKLASFINP